MPRDKAAELTSNKPACYPASQAKQSSSRYVRENDGIDLKDIAALTLTTATSEEVSHLIHILTQYCTGVCIHGDTEQLLIESSRSHRMPPPRSGYPR